ncbi:MAG: hypothetical protein KUG77_19700, partial [Nannocystaceae bacterium]|nr:hypothetical protein [Nannocystaceae bacterium]
REQGEPFIVSRRGFRKDLADEFPVQLQGRSRRPPLACYLASVPPNADRPKQRVPPSLLPVLVVLAMFSACDSAPPLADDGAKPGAADWTRELPAVKDEEQTTNGGAMTLEQLDEELANAPSATAHVGAVLKIAEGFIAEKRYTEAVDVLQRCVDVPDVPPLFAAECLRMLAAAAVQTPEYSDQVLGYVERWRAIAIVPEDTVERTAADQLEGILRHMADDLPGARKAYKRVTKALQSLANAKGANAETRLRLAETHLFLADIDLDMNAGPAAQKHAKAARSLCSKVRVQRETDPEPYMEDTPYGTIVGMEHPELVRARVCIGDAFGVDAIAHTAGKRRDKALVAVERCEENLLSEGAYDPDGGSRCSEAAAHWALQGSDVEHARTAGKRHVALLETGPQHLPSALYERAKIYAKFGSFEARVGSPENARHYLLRAGDLATSAAAVGRGDPKLAKAIERDLAALGSGT